jgi:hypothetical protein
MSDWDRCGYLWLKTTKPSSQESQPYTRIQTHIKDTFFDQFDSHGDARRKRRGGGISTLNLTGG